MASLQDFKSYPGPGETSILEKDGRLSTMPVSEVHIGTYEHPVIALYPDINISRELCHFAGASHQQQQPYGSFGTGLNLSGHSNNDSHSGSPNRSRSSTTAAQPLLSPGGGGGRPLARHASAQHILRPVAEPLIKRCSRIFIEEGLVAVLQEIAAAADGDNEHDGPSDAPQQKRTSVDDDDDDGAEHMAAVPRTTQQQHQRLMMAFGCQLARQALRLIDVLARAQLYVQPQQRAAAVALNVVRLSQTRDWQRSLIRAMAWHPHCMRLAVAACDDSVRIYTDSVGVVPVLKNHLQKGVTAMAWRPFTAGELAVGCQHGVLVWSWDPNSISTWPSQPQLLKHDGHSPVTSLDWSADGRLLATASCAASDVLIWDVDQLHNAPLRRVGAPCAQLAWSPTGGALFTSTVANVFRVWSASDWTPERWTIPAGAVQSAAWSPCGGHLLFVTTDEPYIYSLCFADEQLFSRPAATPKAALPVADLQRRRIGTDLDVGGRPQSLRWDATGQRLAVSFKDTAAVAIFLTSVTRTRLSIVPDCLLVGLGAEMPQHIAFQPRYPGKPETVLAIGWSTGRVQFFPFI